MTWAQTSTGQAVDFLEPDPKSIRLLDIAIGLSRLRRFNGHTRQDLPSYSVATHCLMTEQLCREDDPLVRLHVLMHDAHEFVTGDLITPFKQALGRIRENAGDAVAEIQDRIQFAIDTAAGLPTYTAEHNAEVKRCDLFAMALEKRDLLEPMTWGLVLPDTSRIALKCHTETEGNSRRRFIRRFKQLSDQAKIKPMPDFYEGTDS